MPQPVERLPEEMVAPETVLIEPSSPILNLFTRADEGILRRDWKFAIDSLQRIIDEPEGSLMPAGDESVERVTVYESTRRRAVRLLAELPPEALAAYRLLYDGRAKGLYERAATTMDEPLLRQVVDRFILTRHGDDACDLLASWLLDSGRFGEAIGLLTECLEWVPDGDVPDALLVGKLVTAYLASGRKGEADALIDRFRREQAEGAEWPDWLSALPGTVDSGDAALQASALSMTPNDRLTMPAAEPMLIDPAPWRYALPGEPVYLWQRAQVSELNEPLVLPAVHAATDGERVYVRRPLGCAALDAEDLSVVWEASAPDTGTVVRTRRAPGQGTITPWTGSAVYEDYLAGSLSIAHGLVFTLEREGVGVFREEDDEVRTAPQLPGVVGFSMRQSPTATRLIAYDVKTGNAMWERGRTYEAADPLGDVEFRTAPIAVEDEVWVSYTQYNDLFVAAMRPTDGQLLRRTLLGTLRQAPGISPKLPISYANGVVYVPSAQGALFAVDANTHALRWAVQYPQPEEPAHEAAARRPPAGVIALPKAPEAPKPAGGGRAEWLPTPPVVSRGLVLILPGQGGELLAFTADRGELRWSAPADGCGYVLAADPEHVWLGGRTVRCVSLATGAEAWSITLSDAPTGWGVLAGERLLLPTTAGLTELEARTGSELRSEEISVSQAPLGNLLVARNSVYSVDPSSVRKFPDIARTYAEAEQRLSEEPGDYVAGLRLAWMQLLKGEPDQAYRTLALIPTADLRVNDPRREAAVTHVRVSALLAMAGNERTGASRALQLLQEAIDLSVTAGDRVRSTLALAEQLARMDRPLDAYEALWPLNRTSDAELLVPVADQVEAAARMDIARRMRELEGKLTTDQLARINDEGQVVIDEALRVLRDESAPAKERALATETLEAVADMETPRAVAARAILELTAAEMALRKYERSETLLRACLRLDAGEEATVTALMRLCSVYEAQGEEARGLLQDGLADLSERYADLEIPATAAPEIGGQSEATDSSMTVGNWVASMANRAGLEQDASPEATAPPAEESSEGAVASETGSRWTPAWTLTPRSYQDHQGTAPFEMTGELQQALDGAPGADPPRLIHLNGGAGDRLSPRVLFHTLGDVVYCQRPADGKLLWQTTLRTPGQFAEGLDMTRARATEGIRQAVADGQIAVLNGTLGLYAVGLVSGRQLWIRPHEPALRAGQEYLFDRRMAARDGLFAAMPRPGRLTLMRLRDGSTIWERDLRGEPVGVIELTESRVITADPRLERLHLFDRVDGRLIARVLLRQPDAESRTVSLVESGGILCGADRDGTADVVTGIRLEDGAVAWRVPLQKPVAQLFQPAEGYIGVGMIGGDVKLIDATTGLVAFDRHLSGAHGVTNGILLKTNLLLRAITMQTGEQRIAIMALDLSDGGAELWRRDDLATPAWASVPFGVIDGAIPAVVEYAQPGIPNEARVRYGFAMIDAETGATRATIPDIVPPRSRSRINGDVAVWPDAIVFGTSTGIQAYRLAPMVPVPSEYVR